MKKVILLPDSFKGTMSSIEICNIMSEEVSGFILHAKYKAFRLLMAERVL